MLLHPKVDHEELTCDELRALAKELRVHSAMNGKSEFALYEDKAKDKDYWLATIHQPSTTTFTTQPGGKRNKLILAATMR